jgi:hypothetical protein
MIADLHRVPVAEMYRSNCLGMKIPRWFGEMCITKGFQKHYLKH